MHLIPYARPIIQSLDADAECLMVDPPQGLLDLGRRRTLVAYLRPLMQEVARADARRRGLVAPLMPSRGLLEKAGHPDLVPLVEAAGGFFQVAQELGLRSRRKPPGYWDSREALDLEVGAFVAAAWTQHPAAPGGGGGGDSYYYNQVTGQIRWDAPRAAEVVELDDSGTVLIAEAEGARVMPSQAQLAAAGRWDLHHAILYSGGYLEVAEQLGRRCAPRGRPLERQPLTPRQLATELRAFQRAAGGPPGVLPPQQALVAAGRSDLWQAIRQLGGYGEAALALGLRSRRRPRGHWQRFGAAVEELCSYLKERPRPKGAPPLPTHRELRKEGRDDLRYALQQHDRHQLAEAIGHALSTLPRQP